MDLQTQIEAWVRERVPGTWFTRPPQVQVDGDEILVVGQLPSDGGDTTPEARIARFREESRAERMRIAGEGERRFRRKVSWGASCEGVVEQFTTLSLPVMTRMRQRERQVLDTLIAAGVARSRSEALNWCVRLVAERQADWLADLKVALETVEKARAKGPLP